MGKPTSFPSNTAFPNERTKNPALQDSPPAAGRFSGIFLFRRSAIIVFYFIGISYKIKKARRTCHTIKRFFPAQGACAESFRFQIPSFVYRQDGHELSYAIFPCHTMQADCLSAKYSTTLGLHLQGEN